MLFDYEKAIKNLPNRVRQIRRERGMSQVELAKEAGVSVIVIGNLERGKTGLRLKSACLIADALGMCLEEFLHAEVVEQ